MQNVDSLLESVRTLSAAELEELLRQRQRDDKALRTLWRAAAAREREERRQAREVGRAD